MVMHDISITENRMFCRGEGEFFMERGNTKQDILGAALELFSVQGFEATSISQIASAVGIRKTSLCSHFEDKQASGRADPFAD